MTELALDDVPRDTLARELDRAPELMRHEPSPHAPRLPELDLDAPLRRSEPSTHPTAAAWLLLVHISTTLPGRRRAAPFVDAGHFGRGDQRRRRP
jgi:hypothetical protein